MSDTTITYNQAIVRDNANLIGYTTNIEQPSVIVGIDGMGPKSSLTDAGLLNDRVDESIVASDNYYLTITKNITDSISTQEILSTNSGLTKPLPESTRALDVKVLNFGKNMADSTAINEIIAKDVISEVPTENISTSDNLVYSLNKIINESTLVYETLDLSATSNDFILREDLFFILREDDSFFEREGVFTDPQLDNLNFEEIIDINVNKVLTDTCAPTEIIVTSRGFSTSTDNFTTIDQLSIILDNNKEEVVNTVETIGKLLESNGLQETIIPTELIQITPNKILSETPSLAEVRTFTINKVISDLVGYVENLSLAEFFILREDGSFILREDGTQLYREDLP